jgi:aconitate hydratase
MFRKRYAQVFEGEEQWRGIQVATGGRFRWDPDSTYVRRPSFLENLSREPAALADIRGARVLAVLGDSVTTDHISPAGSIQKDSPAGRYLIERGVQPVDFNSYGARRGNHEVMARGTFANVRLRNKLAPGTEGGFTMLLPEKRVTTIFEAAEAYRQRSVPLVIVAGREYGTGSSRDWAAKGPLLLGVRAVIAESFERIHRSNLIGMGILPLEFLARENAESLRITGHERFDIVGIERVEPGGRLELRIVDDAGASRPMHARVRIDTPDELAYYRNGGILPYVLRQLLAS